MIASYPWVDKEPWDVPGEEAWTFIPFNGRASFGVLWDKRAAIHVQIASLWGTDPLKRPTWYEIQVVREGGAEDDPTGLDTVLLIKKRQGHNYTIFMEVSPEVPYGVRIRHNGKTGGLSLVKRILKPEIYTANEIVEAMPSF